MSSPSLGLAKLQPGDTSISVFAPAAHCHFQNRFLNGYSTVEGWPALRRFDIVGTRGHLQILNGKLVFEKSEIDLRESLETSPQTSAVPATHNQLLPLELTYQGDHTAIYHNLMAALNDMASLIADARSAAMSLELANGMTLSSQTNRPVEFPIDCEEYRQLLARLQGA